MNVFPSNISRLGALVAIAVLLCINLLVYISGIPSISSLVRVQQRSSLYDKRSKDSRSSEQQEVESVLPTSVPARLPTNSPTKGAPIRETSIVEEEPSSPASSSTELSNNDSNDSNKSFSELSVVNNTIRESRPPCTRSQIKNGRWLPISLPDGPPYVSLTSHLRCYPHEYYRQKPYKTWDWVPFDSSCELAAWNASQFCNLLRYATVSIVGDSLSWEMYSSLLQLLGARVRQSFQHKSKTEQANHAQLACKDQTTRFIWRNDPRLENVTDSIRHDFPTVLILNRGAHFKNDTVLLPGIRENIEQVRAWWEVCRKRGIKCHFFWRTSVPGHPGCGNFSEPVNDIAWMESRVANFSLYWSNRSINYHWYDYHHQNKLVLQELEQSGLEEYQVIDAYELNMRRPDEHRAHEGDCLHNCYPGKMDSYNRLLLHFLKRDRREEDSQRLEELFQKYAAAVAAPKTSLDKDTAS